MIRTERFGPATRGAAGFSIIEVMVAVVILAIGLIGLSGLYLAGIQSSKSASLRTAATQQAYAMADRMRANMPALLVTPTSAYHLPTATATAACKTAAGCTAQQMAQNDYYEWNDAASPASNANVLPGGFGVVCIDSTPNDGTYDGTTLSAQCDGTGTQYAIKVFYRNDRSEQATGTQGNCAQASSTASVSAWKCIVTTLQPQL